LFRKKLVFDVFDRYAMAFIPPRFKRLYSVINFFEEFYSKQSGTLIIAGGEKVSRTLQKTPIYFAVLMNCPQEYFIDNEKLKSAII
jgi:hypothetical protein